MIVDSHCHLDAIPLKEDDGETVSAIIKRASDQGVTHFLNVATDLQSSKQAIQLAQEHKHVYASVGIHPCQVGAGRIDYEEIFKLAQASEVIALGETGLDYHYSPKTQSAQWESLREHAKWGRMLSLPLIIHTREADDDMIRFLSTTSGCTGVLHCFTGSKKLAMAAIGAGFYISVSGIITFKNTEELQETIRHLPLERLLVETDAPYLAPLPHRGKRNEPAFVRLVLEKLAQIKGISFEKMVAITTENFSRLFKVSLL